eukprot:scaffold31252_cov63-Phaeocystis_antarctica.AAC.3
MPTDECRLPVPHKHAIQIDLLERRKRAAVQDRVVARAAQPALVDPGVATCGYGGAPCELRQPSTPPRDQEDAAA